MNSIGEKTVLLPAAYFGSVNYWACLMAFPHIIIEAHEHYVKQTLRTRTTILTESGPQTLSVPVASGSFSVNEGMQAPSAHGHKLPKTKQPICSIRISDHGNWAHLHQQALRSAYERSPFFEYYIDDILPLYENPAGQRLLDFDLRSLGIICDLLDFHPHISFSSSYEPYPACVDMRSGIRAAAPSSPRNEGSSAPDSPAQSVGDSLFLFAPAPYYQVFQNRFGFTPNLSILDLLFNMGPETLLVLRDSIHAQ